MFKTDARDLIVQTFEITEERASNFLKSLKIKWTSVGYDQKRMLENKQRDGRNGQNLQECNPPDQMSAAG